MRNIQTQAVSVKLVEILDSALAAAKSQSACFQELSWRRGAASAPHLDEGLTAAV
ncbi:MAG: hypothetical protein QOF27_201 [Gaiellaceae bacterium]|jgi:hypothetical protein|nr:hypothetical protein [Gaiellaceae bacterium]